jgi:hypothetical protein
MECFEELRVLKSPHSNKENTRVTMKGGSI